MTALRVDVGGRVVGDGAPAFLIAEAGVNHNGDLDLARRLVDVAAEAGADAVKFQTFRTSALVSREAPKAAYQQLTTRGDETQHDMLARLELGAAEHATLKAHARARGLIFFSTPFDEASADFLDALGVPLFKVPSGEVTNLPFLRHVAAKRKPVVLSTGMATLAEVDAAVGAIRAAGDPPLVLLHCVSAYPAPAEDTNLRAMDTLRARFGCPVGLSDHTIGLEVAIAAVARGAAVVEKHVTLDKRLPGPDHAASLEPPELAALVRAIRIVERALGDGDKRPMPSERDTRRVARKSLVAARALEPGDVLVRDAVAIKRPGTGISPADLEQVLGRVVARPVATDEVLEWSALEPR
jgi:N-acetylneuraminate synthase/N,N'-diacetyllegionaminate synthase